MVGIMASRMFKLTVLPCALMICNVQGFSHHIITSKSTMNRSHFIEHVIMSGIITTTISTHPTPSNAIEFVPPSPSFSYTYKDAVEIIQTQRLAVDNISNVIKDGYIDEAGFKVMQLNAQTRTAGKIILDTFQENMSISKNSGDSNITLLRFLSLQKKFGILIDLCDECEDTLQMSLKGKSGVTAAVQLKALKVVDDIKSSYDEFLGQLTSFEESTVVKR